MTTHLHILPPDAMLMEHYGRVTYAELEPVYRQILELRPAYVLADGMHMIYTPEVFLDPGLVDIITTYLQLDSSRYILLVVPDGHDMIPGLEQFYTELGWRHKLRIVPTRAAGIATIEQARAE